MTHRQRAAQNQDRKQEPVIGLSPGSLFVGEVIDSIAHLGTVRVAGTLKPVLQGVPLAHLGNGVVGPRNIGAAYPAHTKVLCFHPTGALYCFVLGALPELATSSNFNMIPDWLVPCSGVGLGTDRVHWGALSLVNGPAGDAPFTGGRPCDELPGDHGFINELGVSYGIGRVMAWLRASHFCGVEAFWTDNLLRLTGYNLEVATSASEMRATDDEGEFNQVLRWSSYPWETRGVIANNKDFTREGNGDWQSFEAKREPVKDNQAGLWRVQRLRGYVPDGERTFVGAVLPDSLASEATETLSQRTVLPGLAELGHTSRGQITIRSAKSILLEKTVAIPIPKELHTPEDPTGDNATNYKAAGVFGSGDAHTFTEPQGSDKPGTRGLLLWERHALLYNHLANLGFTRHKTDWFLPEETDAVAAMKLDASMYSPDGELDPNKLWMPMPTSVELDIDHRGKARYYSGRACIQISDDGSIVLEDAYGSQIRMENGNIVIAARNDVITQPGRNAHIWAPHDVVVKAGNAVDVSASLGDVRVKAEGNLMMTSTTRGVLIESNFDPALHGDETPDWAGVGEDVESRGVLIRANHSNFVTLSKDVYIRSGAVAGTETDGVLHMDAGGGLGAAFIHGKKVTARCTERFQTFIVATGADSDTVASLDFSQTEFLLGGSVLQHITLGAAVTSIGHETLNSYTNILGELFVENSVLANKAGIFGEAIASGGSILAQGSLQIGGSFLSRGNIIARAIATDDNNGFVASTDDDFRAKDQVPPAHPSYVKEQLDSARARSQDVLEEQRETDNSELDALLTALYGDNSPYASAAILKNATFSFRVPEQYGTDTEFVFYEARWQQHNRLVHGVSSVWQENPILAPSAGRQTMPYPGYETWTNPASFGVMNGRLFNVATGAAAARSAIDTDPQLATVELVSMSGHYGVTLQQRAK